jgi:alpha-glucosidase
MELNLNEPNKLGDVSWFKPGKYVGIWWEMHLRKPTWGSGRFHGANTDQRQALHGFRREYGFDGVLVEGWNQGWDGDWIANGDKFSFTKAYPDFDIDAIAAYGKAKGVKLIGHNETGGGVPNYENQLDDAMKLYQKAGVGVIKTGYVRHSGDIADRQGRRSSGSPANIWSATISRWSRPRRSITSRSTRTSRSRTRPAPHMAQLDQPRRRARAGIQRLGHPDQSARACHHPALHADARRADGFHARHLRRGAWPERYQRRGQSTLATQLAEYVVLYSPVQMAADLPENYEANLPAFQFIRDVPADWERSITLAGEIGDYVVVARQPRGGKDWFLGAITDEQCAQADAGFGLPRAGQALRSADLSRRSGRGLSLQSGRVRDRETGSDEQGQPYAGHGAGWRRGDPLQGAGLTLNPSSRPSPG